MTKFQKKSLGLVAAVFFIPLFVCPELYRGVFFQSVEPAKIVEKVNKLLDNESLRIKMGQNARKSVEQKFSWETIGQKFEHIYERFAKKPNHTPPTPRIS